MMKAEEWGPNEASTTASHLQGARRPSRTGTSASQGNSSSRRPGPRTLIRQMAIARRSSWFMRDVYPVTAATWGGVDMAPTCPKGCRVAPRPSRVTTRRGLRTALAARYRTCGTRSAQSTLESPHRELLEFPLDELGLRVAAPQSWVCRGT